MECTHSKDDSFKDSLLVEERDIKCMVADGFMIVLPARSMLVNNTEPKRILTKSPTW